jgi:phytoene desaturase
MQTLVQQPTPQATAPGAEQPTAAIVGAGVAGLAVAIRLAVKGYAVTVYEANSYPGGKITQLHLGSYRFDAGPSLFTMPHLMDELFRLAGREPADYFQYDQLEEACRYFYEDGTLLRAYADAAQFGREVEQKLGVPARRVQRHLRRSRYIYQVAGDLFMGHSLHRWQTYRRWSTIKAALLAPTLGLFRSLHSANRRLGDRRLIQLFDRYATYNGSDPYQAPGILQMIPHLEHNIGAAFPRGGMHSITESLYRLAQELGVAFRLNTPVERILHARGAVTGVQIGGQPIRHDLVVSNMDIYPTYRRLLPDLKQPERMLRQERSSSALIFYWGMNLWTPELKLHNIFFSDDYKHEFDQLFRKFELPDDPTVYVNITKKRESADAPAGKENWFILVNVPAVTDERWQTWLPEMRRRTLAKLERMLDRKLEAAIEVEDYLDPVRIEQRTSSYKGALYGTSSNHRDAAFFRHPNFSQQVRGLYFCGGSVHPGGGIPLCLNSARIVAEMVPEAQAVRNPNG